jgi:aminoacyl tRNA synthase complex-interacting multifunctional protein 1
VKSSEDEVLKWVEFSSNFVGKCGEQHALLGNLNQDLSQKSVLLGNGFKPSVADIVVFATIQVFVSHLGENELQKYPHVLRWMDYIQVRNKTLFILYYHTLLVSFFILPPCHNISTSSI